MARREKVLIIGALLVAIFGIFQFIKPKPETAPRDQSSVRSADSRELIQKIETELQKEALNESETTVLAKAALEWSRDPFVGKKLLPLGDANRFDDSGAKDLLYTGYIISGNRKLAIINGLEYMVGDRLITGEFILRHIHPETVVLESTGAPGTVSIPFAGE